MSWRNGRRTVSWRSFNPWWRQAKSASPFRHSPAVRSWVRIRRDCRRRRSAHAEGLLQEHDHIRRMLARKATPLFMVVSYDANTVTAWWGFLIRVLTPARGARCPGGLGFPDGDSGSLTAMTPGSNIRPNDYRTHWQRYKWFKRLSWIILLGWAPILVLWVHFDLGWSFPGVYLLLNYAFGIASAVWPCPRCRQCFSKPERFFYRGGGYPGGIAPQCVHCGLPKFAPDDSGCAPLCPKCRTAAPGRFCTKCGAAQS
jgi:hypothetical protein